MKLNRVENSHQNVISEMASNKSRAVAAHSASQPSPAKARDRRQRSGSNADARSHGAIVNASVARSNQRPNARMRGMLFQPASAGPVVIHRTARNSPHTSSAMLAASSGR